MGKMLHLSYNTVVMHNLFLFVCLFLELFAENALPIIMEQYFSIFPQGFLTLQRLVDSWQED